MITLKESGMEFGEYAAENLFPIENSDLYRALGEGIKTVEFILLRGTDRIFFVEAKSSCPNRENRLESEDKNVQFEEYYRDLTDKFFDSLQVFLTTALKRRQSNVLGQNLHEKESYQKTSFCFVLVIKKAEDITWLVGPKVELEERLKKIRKIWDVKILVLSPALAIQKGFVKAAET